MSWSPLLKVLTKAKCCHIKAPPGDGHARLHARTRAGLPCRSASLRARGTGRAACAWDAAKGEAKGGAGVGEALRGQERAVSTREEGPGDGQGENGGGLRCQVR